MKDFKLMEQFCEATEFLNSHPAVNQESGTFFMFFNFWVCPLCKNNQYKDNYQKPEDVTVNFYRGTPEFDKYVDEYGDEEDFNKDEDMKIFDNIEVPYKVIYGEEWKLDRYVYRGECAIYKYDKSLNKKDMPWMSPYFFAAYQGEQEEGDTFEELIIKLAELVKKKYGDFKYDNFYTEKERENHKTERPFFFIPCPDREGCSTIERNERYISVSDGELNLRWWDWYRKTEHYKEHWEGK